MEVENGLDSQNGLTFIDLFSGIGGFRLGLEQAGHICKGHCEIDRFANQSYAAIHQPKEGEWFADDITKVRAADIPRVDIWCFGFPCQDISTAGKQKGMREGTRSGLFFSVAELIRQTAEEDRPKYLFIENVKNLLSINSGWDFATILFELDELGYDAEWQVLNSKNFGVPQNRERVFVIGHLRGRSGGTVFPIGGENEAVIKRHQIDVSKKGYSSQQDRLYQTDGLMACLPAARTDSKVNIIIEDFYKGREVRTYENESPTLRADRQGLKLAIPVLTPDRPVKRQNGRRFKTNGEPPFTLTAQDRHGVATMVSTPTPSKEMLELSQKTGWRIRKLTPRECWRLQGFPDWAFDRAREAGVSDSQLYKQAGNSVTVNVIKAIGERL